MLRGLGGGEVSLERFFERLGFELLERTATTYVVGASGAPWRLRSRPRAFGAASPGTVRMLADLRAEPRRGGSAVLSTETRVAAIDEASRRAFARYWRVVGPFSALIRRRWLAAAARAIAAANAAAEPGPSDR